MMKRISVLLVCIVLILTLIPSVRAAEQQSFLYSLMQTDDTVLTLVGAPAGEGTITVTVNGEPFSNFNVTTALESGLPITYYCMVDQSTSFSMDQRDQQLRGLTTLSSTMRPQDSMILATMGSTLSFSQPLTDPEERQKAIEAACVYQAYSTALYDYIVTTVQTAAQAQTNDSLNCVVLFTDGLDNVQRDGGLEQTEEAIQNSGISFNAISVMTPTSVQSIVNNARQMERFAEQSLGGIGSTPALDRADSPTNVEDAVADIMRQVLSSSVIQLDLALLPRTGVLDVAVVWEEGGSQCTDSVTVDTDLFSAQTEAALPEAAAPIETLPETTTPAVTLPVTTAPSETLPETAPTLTPSASRTASNKGNLMLVIMLACLGVVVILIGVTLVLLRRRGDEEEQAPEFTEGSNPFIPQSDPVMDISLDFSGLDEPVKEKEPLQLDLNRAVSISTCRVRLVPEGHPQGTVEFTIQANDSVTLGRNSKSAIILNETDNSLSGLHFELQWDSRSLYLRDRNSSNGTALNGVPLRPNAWTRTANKSVIRAGAMNYTILVEKK